jgi:hypothetical protein
MKGTAPQLPRRAHPVDRRCYGGPTRPMCTLETMQNKVRRGVPIGTLSEWSTLLRKALSKPFALCRISQFLLLNKQQVTWHACWLLVILKCVGGQPEPESSRRNPPKHEIIQDFVISQMRKELLEPTRTRRSTPE